VIRILTDRSLKIYFTKYNRKYFGENLHLHSIRFVPNHHKLMHNIMGRTFCFDLMDSKGHPVKRNVEAKIIINARYKRDPRVVLPTLLHEMVHMEHPRVKDCKKSRTFELGMRRLALRGAFRKLW